MKMSCHFADEKHKQKQLSTKKKPTDFLLSQLVLGLANHILHNWNTGRFIRSKSTCTLNKRFRWLKFTS